MKKFNLNKKNCYVKKFVVRLWNKNEEFRLNKENNEKI